MTALGPFVLEDELARGGMGVVYRGAHRLERVPVAVKVIGAELAAEKRFREDFRREVQSAARLVHPNVVTLLDYGAIDAAAARASGDRLVAGSPYVVMEMADSGSLAEHRPGDWPTLRRRLEALLEALAHAHAHAVVHCDLKPANVLLHRGGAAEPSVKLADFGIAHASDRQREGTTQVDQITGTPHYMAPEQIECRWRDYGPWTDLYALGVMVFQLVSGRLPFEGENTIQVLFMQMMEPLPRLEPRFEVPRGLHLWLERLCRKKPEERFQRAADALFALRALDDPSERRATSAPGVGDAPWSAAAAPWSASAPSWAAPDEPAPELASRPPIPESWRGPEAPSLNLLGAGLGLYFLRPVPLVDREAEREALWSALRACDRDRRARAVVLRGASGTGKSRLAAWLCERAHETGAAIVLRAVHEASPGPAHGLERMIAQHYRAAGLSGDALSERLERCLAREGVTDAYERSALHALLDTDPERREPGQRISVRFSSPTERHVVIEGVLARAARERPVIVWLDDVQWGADAIAMVQHALDALEVPVLFVLTARDEVIEERERERELLSALEARCERVTVGPLAAADSAVLIEQLLGLRGELAARVRERVAGNPLFAVQLVGDWVQRGVLALTPQGFALRPGERGELPDDLHAVWIDRVERVLASRPGERELLELAATLGHAVDRAELDALCASWSGAPFPEALVEALGRAHLIVTSDTGFSFAHGMLRESILRGAHQAGRAAAMHDRCAEMLSGRRGRGVAARRGHHLAEAGRVEAALEPLLEAARELRDESDYPQALAMLSRREELLAQLGLPDADERWGIGWALRADVHRLAWDFASAERWAENALAVAEQHGWALSRAEALHVLAHVARQHGDLERAQERNRRALDLFDRLGDDDGRARTLLAMAIVARQEGSFERAESLYRRAIDLFGLVGDARGAANALLGLAHVARHHKDYDGAIATYERARERCEQAGYRAGVANCLMGRADVQRYQGRLDEAAEGYREALAIQRSLGSSAAFIPRLNLGLISLARDRLEEARAIFEAELEPLAKGGKGAYLGLVHTLLLPCAVAAGDLAAFDRHLEAARGGKAMVDEDMAAAAERAGRMLLERGEGERARAALTIAAAQWRALGDEARASEIERALA